MDEQVTTKRRLTLRPIRLTKDGLATLLNVFARLRTDDPRAIIIFEFEGASETVTANSEDAIIKSRLPRDLKGILLVAHSDAKEREIRFCVGGIGSVLGDYGSIQVSATDIDWVRARTAELEDFMSDNSTFHWLFQRRVSLLVQGMIFGLVSGLLWDFTLALAITLPVALVYVPVVNRLFPVVVLDSGQWSSLQRSRRIILYVLGTVFLGVAGSLISRLF